MGSPNVAVVGVGAVGEEMLRVLHERRFPFGSLKVLARTAREIEVDGRKYNVRETRAEEFDGVDIALFAGTEGDKGASVLFGEEATKRGAVIIDNGNDYRMDPKVPLVVPEVNPEDVEWHQGIIASPNCSTIQMVVALKPLYDLSRIRRVIVTTYQAASGAGAAGRRELEEQARAWGEGRPLPEPQVHKRSLLFNVIPQIDVFFEDGLTKEERKLIFETQKIMGDPEIAVTPTCARVPVFNGHSEAITIETERKITAAEARDALAAAPGVRVMDDLDGAPQRPYPTALDADGQDLTLVGRIREDRFVPNALSFWVVADNVRKGAATNAVQIAEEIVRRGYA